MHLNHPTKGRRLANTLNRASGKHKTVPGNQLVGTVLSVSVGLMLWAKVSGVVHSSGLGATVRVGNELGAFVVLTTWKANGEFENECRCGVHDICG